MSRTKTRELDPSVLQDAIAEGLPSAFQQLYDRYADRVRYSVARAAHRHGRASDVDELYQETWCRLLDDERRLLRRYDPTRGAFAPFIGTVAYQQTLVSLHRHRHLSAATSAEINDESLLDRDSWQFAEDLILSELFHKLIARVDDELSSEERVLLQEIHLELRTCRSVATQLGVSENAIYKRNERLKKKLARMMDELLETSSETKPRLPTAVMIGLVAVALAAPRTAADTDTAESPAQDPTDDTESKR